MKSFRDRSLAVFPAGSNGEFNLPPDLAIVISRGQGCALWDTEGNHYFDFSMGWGSALIGHGRPEVTEAVRRQAPLGANFAYVNENALVVAEEVVRVSPACEHVRYCASGTEANMYCMRIARAFTGRQKILKFEGAYHGANDVGVTSLFPPTKQPGRLLDFPAPDPSSAGIVRAVEEYVLVAPYNDLASTRAIIAQHAADLAAVIVEPLHRCLSPTPGFLAGLKVACNEVGALLIFDEVVTGFRLAYGGAQAYYGVIPDLVAYGKALGGGYPIGMFGGRAEIMNLVREDRMGELTYVWTASTLGGNPISTAAARAALEVYAGNGTYERLHALGRYFREGLARVLASRQQPSQVLGDGPLAQVVFTPEPVASYRDMRRANRERQRALMLALFRRGIFLNPMGTKLYLSLAHDESVCDAFLDRMDDALVHLP